VFFFFFGGGRWFGVRMARLKSFVFWLQHLYHALDLISSVILHGVPAYLCVFRLLFQYSDTSSYAGFFYFLFFYLTLNLHS
jgi:hypothetical protein